jgi:hypothetical protein
MAVYDPRGGGAEPVHLDVVLSQISVDWPNEGFVGNRLAPEVRVTKQSNKYNVYGRETWGLPPTGDLRAPGAEANEVPGKQLARDTYFAQDHALRIAVTDEERENVDSPLSPDREATELVTSHITLGRELAIHSMVTTAANFHADLTTTLAGTTQWNDYANSDPIGVVKGGRRAMHAKIFTEPNLAVIPYEVMAELEDHPDFIERIKYSQRGVITQELIASLFGIPSVIVPGVGYAPGGRGLTSAPTVADLGYLWGKDVLLAYVPARAGLRTPAFMYEFVWPYMGQTQYALRWREGKRRSDLVEVGRRYDLKIVAKDDSDKALAGYLIKAAVA